MQKNSVRVWLMLMATLTLMACKKTKDAGPPPAIIVAPPDFGFKVVGYFPSYRNPADVPDVKFRMTNVVNYAFGSVNGSGSLVINSPATFNTIITRAKNNSAKIFLSINGTHADFTNMAANPGTRTNFIKQIMDAIRNYGLHGVDMDWEFPRTSDLTDVTYTKLMQELSDSCHRDGKYYVTAAITAGKYPGAVRDAIKSELFAYIDWFNIMAYDDFSTTVQYKHHSDYTLAQTCLDYWVNIRGMPKAKAVLGIPAYGRASGITQTGTTLSFNQILALGGSSKTDSSIVSTTGYPSPYKIYYNGQPTVKKKAMLAKNMANGIMMWEKWHDTHDATSLLKAVCDTLGRPY